MRGSLLDGRWGLFAAMAALSLGGCGASGDRPGIIVLPGMVESIPFDPYDPNPLTPTGGTLLRPPDGTIPWGGEVFAYGPGPEEAARAGAALASPLAVPSKLDLARGKKVFDTFCAVCHGPEGAGDGPIIGRFPNPPSLLAERARSLPDGHLFHIVTRGQGIMASYAAQVLPGDRWRVIAWVRSLQGAAAAPAAEPAAPAAEPVPPAPGPDAPGAEPTRSGP